MKKPEGGRSSAVTSALAADEDCAGAAGIVGPPASKAAPHSPAAAFRKMMFHAAITGKFYQQRRINAIRLRLTLLEGPPPRLP